MKKRCAVVLLLALGLAAGAPAKRELVRRLLRLSGAGAMGQQVMDQLFESQRKMLPQVPDSVWQELRKAMTGAELEELVVPIYERHLDEADLRGIIAFYETPAGAKLIRVQPQIMRESMSAGQAWGMDTTRKVMEKLRERGYVKD